MQLSAGQKRHSSEAGQKPDSPMAGAGGAEGGGLAYRGAPAPAVCVVTTVGMAGAVAWGRGEEGGRRRWRGHVVFHLEDAREGWVALQAGCVGL